MAADAWPNRLIPTKWQLLVIISCPHSCLNSALRMPGSGDWGCRWPPMPPCRTRPYSVPSSMEISTRLIICEDTELIYLWSIGVWYTPYNLLLSTLVFGGLVIFTLMSHSGTSMLIYCFRIFCTRIIITLITLFYRQINSWPVHVIYLYTGQIDQKSHILYYLY
jgi:hypothetical protein